jgi:hypothetical protein
MGEERMRYITAFSAVLLLATAFAGAGCKKKSEAIEEINTDDSKPAVDPALAEAVAAASASAEPSAEAGQAQGGPPPTGVFPPGGADKELARGAAPKITLGGDGVAPRVKLTGLPPLGKHQLRVRLGLLQGGRAQLPVDLQVVLAVSQPKPGAGADAGAPVLTGLTVVAAVEDAKVDAARLAQQVPPDLEKAASKLEGSKVTFSVDSSGTGRDFAIELSKDAASGPVNMMNALAGLLATVTLPVPDKPVGQGALWMATTRETVLGIDTVSYRLIKLEKFEGNQAVLKIDTKRYAADARQMVPELSKDGAVEFQRFQAEGTGFVNVPTTGGFPLESKITRELQALLITTAGQAQPLLIQERVEGVIEVGAGADSGVASPAPGSPSPASAPPAPEPPPGGPQAP